jgi:glycosidase
MKGLCLNKKAKENLNALPMINRIDRITADDLSLLRSIVYELNLKNAVSKHPEKVIKASELFGMIVLGDIYQNIFDQSKKENTEYTEIENKENFEEWLKHYFFSQNPSLKNYWELFKIYELKDPKLLKKNLTESIKYFGIDKKSLFDFILNPITNAPNSLKRQLEYIYENWAAYLGDEKMLLLKALDLLKEEEKWSLAGPGESKLYSFISEWEEPERFSPDKDWMSSLVLLAKNIFVWLDQLSEKYTQEITKLDQIPDEELHLLAQSGFTGLWLIGIWERSRASQRIKHLMGNTDALASAYSLKRYQVAYALGGEESLHKFSDKAWKFGIRLGCDMVPNHMAIDSDWIYEHPDWFIQCSHPPFPSYTFTGENLSDHPNVEIYLEDHYYDHTDAAVVFKYIDHRDGRTRYIYHGNDGTSFPWNDTAQLNYLLPEVREAVIQQILCIAGQFPIIRFDAAMTLSKKHFQRLWFPEAGTGGDIPSRAEYSMSKRKFNELMPVEFWREVVERVADEAPDTLLLAEAFWMMEGYFVRTLGMHRVYNSAFMNMLKREENSNYRQSIKNVLEFDPQILKRFVNFMSNPDEETAVAQFGSDDKYFGVCILMSTMPGLPMFAHGQVQGFHERYGMEFFKPKWKEPEQIDFIERHKREIFPLLRKRYMFSDVRHYHLFDFTIQDGMTDENVFAYSNEYDGKKSLIIYHNKYENTKGWIHWTYDAEKDKNGEAVWVRGGLAEILAVPVEEKSFVIFRDIIQDREYIRNAKELHEFGLFIELGAFKYAVFMDFRIIHDDNNESYKKLSSYLQGGGVKNLKKERKRNMHREIYESFDSLVSEETFLKIFSVSDDQSMLDKILEELSIFLHSVNAKNEKPFKINDLLEMYKQDALKTLSLFDEKFTISHDQFYILYLWLVLRRIGGSFIEEYGLDEQLVEKINSYTQSDFGNFYTRLIKFLISEQELWEHFKTESSYSFLEKLFEIEEVRELLEFNWFDGTLWFKKEAFDEFFILLEITQTVSLMTTSKKIDTQKILVKIQDCFHKIRKAYAFSDFKVEQFLEGLK